MKRPVGTGDHPWPSRVRDKAGRLTLMALFVLALFPYSAAAQGTDGPVFGRRPDTYPDAQPGFGYPGRLIKSILPREVQSECDRLGLTAYTFRRAPLDPRKHAIPPEICPNQLTFVHAAPTTASRPCPLLLFIPGTGSQGDDPALLLRQSGFYAKVLGKAFQEIHPCHLFVPLIPRQMQARAFQPGVPHPLEALICDALFALAGTARPPVDRNRLYVTGFSFGGNMAFDFCCVFPGRFAAAIPIAALQRKEMIPREHPGRYWLLYNEGDFRRYRGDARVLALQERVLSRGGEFHIGCYPEEGHNAWSAAWQEDRIWEWLFSKTADGRPAGGIVRRSTATPLKPPERTAPPITAEPESSSLSEAPGEPAPVKVVPRPLCSASQPGRDAKSGAQMGADGLDGTCYVSAKPVSDRRLDWWMIAYPEPVQGRGTVYTGDRRGGGALTKGVVEVSISGEQWTRVRSFDKGICSFNRREPFRYLRVIPRSKTPEPLVVREVVIGTKP